MYVAIVSIEMRLSVKSINKCVLVNKIIAWMVDIVIEFCTDSATDAFFMIY
jgi:hypoxanthine-guanine phosphoribosyltransferase